MEDHTLLLKKFFKQKGKNDQKRILEKKAKVRSKKTFQYNVQHDKFSLVDANGSEVISVARVPKRSLQDTLHMYEEHIQSTQTKLLDTKYRLLYEYEPITGMTSLEPMEKQLDIFMRKRKKVIGVQKKHSKEDRMEELRIKMQPIKEQLRGAASMEEKKIYIKEYIQFNKEMLELNSAKIDDIQEITINANEEELFTPVQDQTPIPLNPIVINDDDNSNESESNSSSSNESNSSSSNESNSSSSNESNSSSSSESNSSSSSESNSSSSSESNSNSNSNNNNNNNNYDIEEEENEQKANN